MDALLRVNKKQRYKHQPNKTFLHERFSSVADVFCGLGSRKNVSHVFAAPKQEFCQNHKDL